MEILSLSLQNFKAHRDRQFEFQPGTNAICGENGAGKTSLLEAIAWVLFNYRGAYIKEDLIRNGASSAQARVRFVSNRDGRTYEVSRCTTAGYSLYDPQLKVKLDYSRIEDEVLPWLRQHLGVAPGTDLAHLFSTTLGIPQGTFTADFLLTPEKRKPIFDRILKVEEYQTVYRETLSLQRYAEAEVEKLKTAIAQYEDTLQSWTDLTTKQQDLQQQIQQVTQDTNTAQQYLVTLEADLAAVQQQAAALETLQRKLDALETQIQSQTQLSQHAEQQLVAAEQAATLCRIHQPAYQGYLQAETALKTLEAQRQIQIELQTQRQTLTATLRDRQAQQQRYEQDLQHLDRLEQELAALTPQVEQQTQLEQQQLTLQAQLQVCQQQQALLNREQQHLQALQENLTQLQAEIATLEALATQVESIPALEADQARLQQQMSRIEAATQFQVELQRMFEQVQHQTQTYTTQIQTATQHLQELQAAVPLWAEAVDIALAALHQGQTLQVSMQSTLKAILTDLEAQTSLPQLQARHQHIQTQLKTAQQQQAQYLTLPTKIAAQDDLEQQIQESLQHLEALQAHAIAATEIKKALDELSDQLQALQNPRSQQQYLRGQLANRAQLIAKQDALVKSLQEAKAQSIALDQQLEPFSTLVEQWQAQQHARDEYRSGYQLFLQNQDRGQQVDTLRQNLQAIAADLATAETQRQTVLQERETLSQTYNLDAFRALQAQVQKTQTQIIQYQARLPEMQQRLIDLDQQVNQLVQIQVQCEAAQTELKQREQVKRFIGFARKAFKEAGPRITERYIVSISQEADRIFRELITRPNVSLTWTRDYEITVREDAHIRRFVHLSGGEQMCAALAVRLALLRVLADFDIAFFDEPTTNMDRLRRQQLAGAIANIRSFRQLFVISHDDTFEQVTENVIFVARDDGSSG